MQNEQDLRVIVTVNQMGFMSAVVFILKWTFALIPALIILSILGSILAIFIAIFLGF
ncbi:hypothetical protein [Candidatus Palauibacter sp.]|uniref:hypothetical protein n=1 Tax=Candidatus Palauibacter sp. TaxID=3101350 RepID=UPI003CC60527